MTKISLTRNQLYRLSEIAIKFPDTEWFTIQESSPSGIGAELLVKFTIFDYSKDYDTIVDLTDLGSW